MKIEHREKKKKSVEIGDTGLLLTKGVHSVRKAENAITQSLNKVSGFIKGNKEAIDKAANIKTANYKLNTSDRAYEHFASAAYEKNPGSIYGYDLDHSLSGKNTKVFINKKGKVIVSFRGTAEKADLKTDLKIVGRSRADSRFKDAEKLTQSLIKKYGVKNVTVAGHSLGGTIARYVSSKTGVSGTVFNAGASPSELGSHVDTNVKVKTIVTAGDPISNPLIGGKGVVVRPYSSKLPHAHSIESPYTQGKLKPEFSKLKGKTAPTITPTSSGATFIKSGQGIPNNIPQNVANVTKIENTASRLATGASQISSKLASGALIGTKIAGFALKMVGETIIFLQLFNDAFNFFYSLIDWNNQKREEEDVANWSKYFTMGVEEKAYVVYTSGIRKSEKTATTSTPYNSLEEVKSWWGPSQSGDDPNFSENYNISNSINAPWVKHEFAKKDGHRVPTIRHIDDLLSQEPDNLHYALMTTQEKENNPIYKKYVLVREKFETFNPIFWIPKFYTDKRNIYYIPPEELDTQTNKIPRYIEVPTILNDTEESSKYKFIFKRHPKDNMAAGIVIGGNFDYLIPSCISGNSDLNYYQWMELDENQRSYGIYNLWKSTYPNIPFAALKKAFVDPQKNPTEEELEKMNQNGSDLESAQKEIAKSHSTEVLQLAQTPELLKTIQDQLIQFLQTQASDPQSVYTYLFNLSSEYGGWTESSWKFLWDDTYNVWREDKGLLRVERNSDFTPQASTAQAESEGALVTPAGGMFASLYKSQDKIFKKQFRGQSQLFAPLYKPQNQKFKKQFHGKSRRHLS